MFAGAGQGRTAKPTVPEPVEGIAGGFGASTRLGAGKLSHRFTRSAEMGVFHLTRLPNCSPKQGSAAEG